VANGHRPAVARRRELPAQERRGGKALSERNGDGRDRKSRSGEKDDRK
jgi:hypothetical protein